ncbi:MAG: acetyl-CoA carboxylase biotin carboxyl carrier protein [Provencibacterium sp.]|jgi:acetyl-CoA carboxylase biotin carboxyl carrier protein|nr:acetyl-CoA carboxylase biotin carboxyl carrier protein [Provencibacterium sp.]
MNYSVEEIKELMQAFRESGLQELRLSECDCKLCLRAAAPAASPASPAAAASEMASEPFLPALPQTGSLVKSPIVGTFYTAPSPEAEPFVKVGDRVKKGDVLFIIESMKLMNEVTSEFEGTVAEILAKSGDPVEYGQELMRIE